MLVDILAATNELIIHPQLQTGHASFQRSQLRYVFRCYSPRLSINWGRNKNGNHGMLPLGTISGRCATIVPVLWVPLHVLRRLREASPRSYDICICGRLNEDFRQRKEDRYSWFGFVEVNSCHMHYMHYCTGKLRESVGFFGFIPLDSYNEKLTTLLKEASICHPRHFFCSVPGVPSY